MRRAGRSVRAQGKEEDHLARTRDWADRGSLRGEVHVGGR